MNKLLLAVGMAAPLACGSLSSQAADEAVSAAREPVPWASSGWWQIYTNNPVLRPGAKGEWDAGALGSMSVLKVGEVFHMYYEAWGVRGAQAADYLSLQIGHATSRDGLHWTKDPANPVLPKGSGQDWDRDGTWDPFVLYEDGVFKMWYGGGENTHCDWGYAVSTDGVHFTKKGQISHLGNVEDDHVVHDPITGRCFMYYWDRKQEPDGLFRAQSPNETDFDFAHAAPVRIEGLKYPGLYKFTHVFQQDGQCHMFFAEFAQGYAAQKGDIKKNALAINMTKEMVHQMISLIQANLRYPEEFDVPLARFTMKKYNL